MFGQLLPNKNKIATVQHSPAQCIRGCLNRASKQGPRITNKDLTLETKANLPTVVNSLEPTRAARKARGGDPQPQHPNKLNMRDNIDINATVAYR
jgi:hypothetical protein